MNIFFLARWYPSKFHELNGLFIQNHATAVASFVNVYVIYVHSDPNLFNKIEINENHHGDVKELRIYFPKKNKLLHPYYYLKAHFNGFKYLENKNITPDLIHVHVLSRLGVIALIYKIFNKTPYIITEHWTRYFKENNSYKGIVRKILTRLVVKHASIVLPVTKNLMSEMQKHGLLNKNYQIINNVVNTNLFVPTNKQNKKKQIVHISNFNIHHKNTLGIIDAVELLTKIRTDFELVLIGSGNNEQLLKKYISEKKIKKYVVFKGVLRDKSLVKTLSASCCLILFSNYENFPVVITESFACGIPVISSDVGGISEHINQQNGMLVKPRNIKQLSNAINFMLDNYKNYDKNNIRQYAIKNFSYNTVGKQLYEIYKNTLK